MRKKVGLWIDHTKAVLFSLADEGAEIKRIVSELENTVRTSAGGIKNSIAAPADARSLEQLKKYYDEVLAYLRDAESILIFGPGEAKDELKKRLELAKLHGHIVGMETVEKMTDNQIVTKVRQHFLK